MPSLLLGNGHWLPFIARFLLLRAIVQWWRAGGVALEQMNCDQASGASSGESFGQAELLYRRAMALHLDLDELSRSEPLVLREFERSCAMCRTRGRCVLDLAQEFARDPAEPADQDWRDYCPNAAMLKALSTLQGCAERRSAVLSFDFKGAVS